MAATKSTQFLFPNTDEYRAKAEVLGSIVKEREVVIKERIVFELTPGAARDIAHVLLSRATVPYPNASNPATDELLKQLTQCFNVDTLSEV